MVFIKSMIRDKLIFIIQIKFKKIRFFTRMLKIINGSCIVNLLELLFQRL